MTVKISKATERAIITRLLPTLIEPAWVNRNRVEARAIAEATARKIAAETIAVIALTAGRQIAPATVEV